jgi:hypothetical protein
MLISFNKNKNDKELHESKLHGCSNISTKKIFKNSIGANYFMNYNTTAIQAQLNKL